MGTLLPRVRSAWRVLMGRTAFEREMDEEFREHIALRAEDLERSGVSATEALRRARLEFGSLERYKEEGRASRGVRLLDELRGDLRLAWRSVVRSPGFALALILTLALGIGANTAIFSVVDAVLLRPLPFPDADRLVVVWGTDRTSGTTREPNSYPDFSDVRERAGMLSGAAAFQGAQVTWLPVGGGAERVSAIAATHDFLPLLGTGVLLGRGFEAAEDAPGAERVAALGAGFWRARFGADPGVIGRSINLDGVAHTIVGIVPDDAAFGVDQVNAAAAYGGSFRSGGRVDVWLPLRESASSSSRDTHPFLLIGRLAPTASVATASADLARIATELEQQYPSNAGRGFNVEPLSEVALGPVRPALLVLFAAVALVLLVACVNVANLLLARGTVRIRDVAVRSALGAGRERIARQFLIESLLLTALAAIIGLALAWLGLRGLLAIAPADVPRLQDVGLDVRVLAFTGLVAIGVATVFSLVPTLQAGRVNLQATLKSEGNRGAPTGARRNLRSVLVVAELALAVTLVVAAGLALRSFGALMSVDPGFQIAQVMKAQFELPESSYPRDFAKYPAWPETHAFHSELLRRVSALPGVDAVAIAGAHPLDAGFTNSFVIVGRESEAARQPEIRTRQVSAGYFEALGVPVRSGRAFTPSDDVAGTAVVVVNEAAAQQFFPGTDPIGQQVRFWGVARTIIGVVGDERFAGLAEEVQPALYTPIAQSPSWAGTLLVRSTGDPAGLVRPVRAIVRSLDAELALYGVETMEETLSASVSERRFLSVLLTIFGAVALLLALVGVHGVLSFTVAQRAPEVGIRMALGASRADVLRLIVGEGVALAAAGVALGLLGAIVASRIIAGLLYGVSSTDPATYAVVAVTSLLVAAGASWAPARRAARIDPVQTLRGG